MTETILSQSYGYGFVVGLGAAFAVIMCGITYALAKYLNQIQNSEMFSTASRNVGSGLISSAVVSSWVWPATILTSSLWGYTYGISGGYLYGISGTFHILAFALLAIEIKRIAPSCHTIGEIVKVRYDRSAHFVYMFYVCATNLMVASCLLLGASQGFNAATGMSIIAANFLIPLSVCVYTMFGGIKATFLSDWIHTVIIYLVILVMVFKVLTSSDIIGSPGKFYDMIIESEKRFPATKGTSFLSFKSKQMFMTTWSVNIGGFASVFGDPSYGQKAIAAKPKSVLAGYVLGGLCWLTVPWALGTFGGLVARALLSYDKFITYPNELTSHEASAGLPLIYAMGTIMGTPGAAAAMLDLFLSVTSALSAELIAFSSISTFDVYRGYINPKATGKQLIRVSHSMTMAFSLLVACVSVIFNYVGVTVGWLIGFYGILLAPGATMLVLTLYWRKTSSFGLAVGAPIATGCGIICWIATAYAIGGRVDKNTLMTSEPSVVGNFVSLGSSVFTIPILSLLKPDAVLFDFKFFETAFTAADDADEAEKAAMITSPEEKKELAKASKIALVLNALLLFGGYLIVPLCFYGTDYKFSKKYFTQWTIIIAITLLLASFYIIFFPLYQGLESFKLIYKGIFGNNKQETIDASGQGSIESEIVEVSITNDKEKA